MVSASLEDLAERSVDFTALRLYWTDGNKAIRAAIRRHAGDAAPFQRCQVHKIFNAAEHVPVEKRDGAINPDAAASLREGTEKTLTVIELRLPRLLRRSLSTTNGLE